MFLLTFISNVLILYLFRADFYSCVKTAGARHFIHSLPCRSP